MNEAPHGNRGADPVLLVEAGLIFLLLILFVVLYVYPTANRLANLPWWSPVLLGGLSLTVLILDAWRRRRRNRREMIEMLEEHLGNRR